MLVAAHSNAATGVVSLSIGSHSSDEGLLSTGEGANQEVVSLGSGESFVLGWGVANKSSRFLLEYYYSAVDAGESDSLDKSSLFYSGYWTPILPYGFSAIAGVGLGITYINLSGDDDLGTSALKDNGLEYKLSLGLEYRLNEKIEFYGLFEKIYGDEYSDKYTPTGGGAQLAAKFKDDDQSRFSLGVNYYY